MSSELTVGLINNAALLLALSIIFEISFIFRCRSRLVTQLVCGILIGLIGVAIMSMPYELVPGVFYDTRSILLCVTALIFGFRPAAAATLIMTAYRIVLGGAGLVPGISMIVATAALGLLARKLIDWKAPKWRWLKLYIFGLCVHAVYLSFTFMLPWETAVAVIRRITFPIFAIYPVGVLLLSLLLLRQKEHNEALIEAAEAESRYKSLFYNSHAAMLILDPEDGRIFDANPAAASFYGWSEDTLKTMLISQISTSTPEDIKQEMQEAVSFRRNYFQFRHITAAGGIIDVEIYTGPIEFKGRTLLYSVIHDISVRVEALKALQESEKRFRTVVDNAPDAIFVMLDKTFAYANKAGLTLLGAEKEEELIGRTGLSVIHPDYVEGVYKYMEGLRTGAKPLVEERAYIRLDKTVVHVEVMVVPIRYSNRDGDLVFARDITERKLHQQKEQELEAQLRQQQKLEAIGTLAGGVAHEINNPLNGIMNYAQLILDDSVKDSVSAEYAREIIHETERISTIVRNLLQFSRQEKKSHSSASIYDIVGQTISLVNTVIKKDQITLDIRLDENLPDIKCRSQQIQQVFMNLLTNARDAVNERFPGCGADKCIRVRCFEHSDDGTQWLRLTVTDNGCGIPQELKDRIFEPFFSTKPKETGTGLGLSISYGIVSEHRGRLSFESEPGEYTTFILDLPVDNGWTLDTE
jgi:PAS domain S-box-containing protein